MKRYLFIFIAMFTVAFTTISLTSCSKDDDSSKDTDVYSGKVKTYIYDPGNELTADQKTQLQAMLDRYGVLDVPYVVSEKLFKDNHFDPWYNTLLEKFYEYVIQNPSVADTNAGIKMVTTPSWGASEEGIIPFSIMKKEEK